MPSTSAISNYGRVFVIWDKLLGPSAPTAGQNHPCTASSPAHTWNPVIINFQHLGLLIRDAWLTSSWKDKLRIWFMPTGWRPADVRDKYPVALVTEPYALVKYDTQLSRGLLVWSWLQFAMTILFALYLFNQIATIGAPAFFCTGCSCSSASTALLH